MVRKRILLDYDPIQLQTGEILSVVGTYKDQYCRARLSFIPLSTKKSMKRSSYKKIHYETGLKISGCQKLLDLPGEQHFLVKRKQIVNIFSTRQVFSNLPTEQKTLCDDLISSIRKSCGIKKNQHGLFGSSALKWRLPTSDFDWVIYGRVHNLVRDFLITATSGISQHPFSWVHVQQKYGNYTGLSETDLYNLFRNRWRYFNWHDLMISISFVDPELLSDQFLEEPVYGKEIKLSGKTIDSSGCYYVPRIIKVDCDGVVYKIFTWLFLYNGAFKDGDFVEFSGIQCNIAGQKYIMIQELNHYIRVISKTSNEIFSSLIFRKAEEKDLPNIIELLGLPEVDNSFVLPLSQRAETIEARVKTRHGRGFWITVWDENLLCGCWSVYYDPHKETATFSTLAIRPKYQGKGIGRKLMQESVGLCINAYNPKKLQFDSWSTNKVFEKLALRLGFVKIAEYDDPAKRPYGIKSILYERICGK